MMAIFKAPILCDCRRTYCANDCGKWYIGSLTEATFDCRSGVDCGTKRIGTMCTCQR